MTAARAVALGALAVGLVLVAALLLGGDGGTRYVVRFQNAGQLVKDDDVQVGGRRIGSVREIELTDDNQARITIEVEDAFAPLHEGTTAVIRATSLSGIANRYIALSPGPNNRPALPEGAVLDTDKTTSPVDLDQLFNTLDPEARRDLQRVIRGSADWYAGKGRQANEANRYFSPALSTTDRVVTELLRDQQVFTNFVVDSSKLVTALAARRGDLAGLVGNANATARAIGDENVALDRTLQLLPATLRKANTTFVNLRATLDDLDVLVDESKPATKDLAKFFRELRPLVAAARPTIRDLRRLIRERGPNNDLIGALRKTPRLESLAGPTFDRTITALEKSQPVIQFIRPYTPDLVGWLRDFGQSSSNYDANGHFSRIQPIFNAFSFTDNPAGGTLTPIPNSQRFNGLQQALRRCPGAASQATADGSAPFRDDGTLDCDPSLVPPGP